MLLQAERAKVSSQARRAIAPFKPAMHSNTWTFFDGDWREGNAAIMGPRTHAAWLGSMVFDGARGFEGVAPDLERHCARVNVSAASFALQASVSVEDWVGLAKD